MVERSSKFLLIVVGSVCFMLILYQYVAPGVINFGSPHGYFTEEDEGDIFPTPDPHYVKKYYFPVRDLERTIDFQIKGEDVIVFLHIQKTGGTTFGRHLVQNVRLEVPCDCRPGQKKCTCYRPNRKETWLFSRFSTGWSCGLHADWTELTNCVPGVLNKKENKQMNLRKFYYITLLRDPVSRYLSEWRHVQRGATWKTSLHMCDGRTPTPEELPSCYEGSDWSGCTLQQFMDCPYNLANNRQVRMLADLSLVGCYNMSTVPEKKRAQLLLESAKKNLRDMAFFGLTEYQRKTQFLFERTFRLRFIRPFMQYNSTRAASSGGFDARDSTMRSDPVVFTSSRAMEELVCELRLFLDLLDREYLSAGVREKKMHLSKILHRVLSDKEPSFKSEIHSGLPAPPQMPLPAIPHPWLSSNNGPPPLPSSSLPEGYYEEAVPLSPGKAPEYITSNYDSDAMSSSYESYDEEEEDGKGQKMRHQWPSEEASMDLVKDSRICAFLLRKKRFGQWTKLLCVIKDNKLLCYKSSKDHTPQMELSLSGCSITHIPKDGKKKKHELKIVHQGADALVLAVQSKEQAEEWLKVMREVCVNGSVDLDGAGSGSPVHRPELEKKASCDRPSSDGEAVHENGHSDCKDQGKGKKNSKSEHKTGTVGKGAGKKITKIIGLGKKKPSTDEQTSSAEEDVPTCGYLNVLSNNRWRERWCRLKDNQLLLHKDRDDLKSHIASLPLRGCEVSPGLDHKHPFAFRLLRNSQEVAVLEASSSEELGRWLGVLLAETGSTTDPATLHYDYIDVETTANVIQLAKQSFCFTSKRAVSPNPYLDNPVNGYACPTGMALHYDDVPINGMDPEALHSSPSTGGRQLKGEMHYENAELYDNMPSPKLASRFPPKPSSSPASSSSKSAGHYKTPVSKVSSKLLPATKTKATAQLKGKKGAATNGVASKQKAEPKNQSKKNGVNGTNGTASLKRNNSNAEQCKYGKNRVEADAKRLQTKEDELMKKKQEIRSHLTQLKKERTDLRTAVEAAAGKRSHGSLTERLKKVEEQCRQKEEERVNLELELTEVKESLKKALSGGVTLGLTIEPKAGSSGLQSPAMLRRTQESSPFSSCETSDTESCSLPVNSASLLRRQQAGQKAPTVRGHVLRKAKEWEQKSGT